MLTKQILNMSYCILHPQVNGKPSKLWQGLMDYYRDREFVIGLYVVSTRKTFYDNNSDWLVFDENGEPTAESVISFMNRNGGHVVVDAKLHEEDMNSRDYESVADLVNDVVAFNKEHNDLYAEIQTTVGREKVKVRQQRAGDELLKQRLERTAEENRMVTDTLKKFGINVNILDANLLEEEDAFMDTSKIGNLAKGMMGVINIANNFNGYKSLTEEFAHFFVEVLRAEGNPIIERAERFFMEHPDFENAVLGNDKERVRQYYSNHGNEDLVHTEALGRFVARIINGVSKESNEGVATRAAEYIRKFINETFKVRDEQTRKAVDDLVASMTDAVRNFVKRDSLRQEVLSRMKHTKTVLAHTKSKMSSKEMQDRLKKVTESAENNLIKFLSVYENSVEKSKEMTEIFTDLHNKFKRGEMINGIVGFLKSVTDNLSKNLDALYATSLTEELSLYEIRDFAHQLLSLKNTMQCFRQPAIEMKGVLREMQKMDELTEEEKTIVDDCVMTIIPNCIDMLNTVEQEFDKLNHDTIRIFAKSFFNDGNGDIVVPWGKDKDKIITLENVLNESDGDISLINRMLLSAANTDDNFIQLVDHIIQMQNEDIRAITFEIDHKIQIIDKEFRNSGEKYDTKFIYERDDKGKLTGNYVSGYKIWKWQRERQDEIDRLTAENTVNKGQPDEYVDEDKVLAGIQKWDKSHSKRRRTSRRIWFTDDKGKRQKKTIPRSDLMPNESYRDENFQKGWTAAQKKYYDQFMDVKQNSLDILLPEYKTHPYRAIQMMVASTGEAILNSDNGFFGGVKNAMSAAMDNYFRITENDEGEYFDGTQGKVKMYINALKKKYSKDNISDEASTTLNFDKTVYKQVPTYFLKNLEDMSKLSTDATSSLREYNIMACHYNGMHKIVDIIELIRELNRSRNIYQTQMEKRLFERKKKRIGDEYFTSEIASVIPTEETNIYKRVNELIDMGVYKQSKLQGRRLIGDLTTSKLCDDLIKLTSFSLLGYSAFSGINNVLAAKYQMLIESWGGHNFDVKEWLFADKEYMKHAGEMFAELRLPYTTSFLGLLGEMFNVGQNWKERIKSSKAYRNNFQQFMSNFGPSCMLESGEHSIQMSTAIAYLKHYKLYKGEIQRDEKGRITNESVSLYDAIEKTDVLKEGKVVDAKLKLKDQYKDYVDENGEKFNLSRKSMQVKKLSMKIGKCNQDMHGIYNHEDLPVLTRFGVGRMLILFRKHMVPQIQKRYKTAFKYKPIYNMRSGEWEEGYMVTLVRFLRELIQPFDETRQEWQQGTDGSIGKLSRFQIAWNSLNDYRKANMRKALAEFASLIGLTLLVGLLMNDWDEDNEWIKRQALYFAKRVKLEAEMPYRPDSFMDIINSPSAVISQTSRYYRLGMSIGQGDKILASGPYKGHSVLYANFMRAVPVYPQIYDFIFLDEDNRRFRAFSQSQTPIIDLLSGDDE